MVKVKKKGTGKNEREKLFAANHSRLPPQMDQVGNPERD